MDYLAVLNQIERIVRAAKNNQPAAERGVCSLALDLIDDVISDGGLDAALGSYRAARRGRAAREEIAHERTT